LKQAEAEKQQVKAQNESLQQQLSKRPKPTPVVSKPAKT